MVTRPAPKGSPHTDDVGPTKWPHDDTAALKRFYGDPTGQHGEASPLWQARNLVVVPFPWVARLAWDTNSKTKGARFHRLAAPALERVFDAIWDHAGKRQSEIEAAGVHLFGGTFNYRVKRGLSSLSVHAFGAAIDFDPEHNALGAKSHHIPDWVVECFAREGAVWGGTFRRKDAMHFQFAAI